MAVVAIPEKLRVAVAAFAVVFWKTSVESMPWKFLRAAAE
jgi:hypothetical protein